MFGGFQIMIKSVINVLLKLIIYISNSLKWDIKFTL